MDGWTWWGRAWRTVGRETKNGGCGCVVLEQLHGHVGGQRNPVALGWGELDRASVLPGLDVG